MDYLTNYYKTLCEQLQEKIALLEAKAKKKKKKMAKKDYDKDGKLETSEQEYLGSRDNAIKKAMQSESFNRPLGMRPMPAGPVTSEYMDAVTDPPPNVATMTTAQERAARDQARVRPIDTFGGQYPSPEFGDLARSADSARRAAYPLEGKLREAEIEAQRQHMRTTKYRGRPVSQMSPGSKAYQAAMSGFRTSYQPPEDLAAQLRGSQILSKLSQRILQTHPQYDQFEKDEELRGDIILGRKNSDGTWRQSYLRDKYTGD